MNLAGRVWGVIRSPRAEWARIAAEPAPTAPLHPGAVALLAAVPAMVQIVRMLIDGMPRADIADVALSNYVMALVFAVALAAYSGGLASLFGGVGGLGRGFRLAGLALAPVWLSGVFLLLPVAGWVLALAGMLYGIYVYWLGIVVLLRVPSWRAVLLALSAIAAAFLTTAAIQIPFDLLTGHLTLVTPRPR